jgi:serine/threonine-protein kinase HipA
MHPKKLKLAMSWRDKTKHYRMEEIQRRHFNATARACGLGRDMEGIIEEVVERTSAVIDSVGINLPVGFPDQLFARVSARLRSAADRLAKMPAA